MLAAMDIRRGEAGAIMLTRAELCERLAVLRTSARMPEPDFAASVAAIRRLALAYGLTPVVRLADALARAGAHDPCAVALYLDRLHDAIGCEPGDEQASQAMLASISIRLHA